MPHSAEETLAMAEALNEWRDRSDRLTTALLVYPYGQARAREMAEHGACRRLRDLQHCLRRVFEVLPPEAVAPERDNIFDATMFVQAFIINIYGTIDNLAWIWTYEKPVVDVHGNPPQRSWVGFKVIHRMLRASVSDDTRAFLEGADDWFDLLESFRDALAHRIPLYIPSLTVTQEESDEVMAFQVEVMAEGWSLENYARVMDRMRAVGKFEPMMTHSIFDAPRVPFHQQMICDVATVISLGEHLLSDLNELHA